MFYFGVTGAQVGKKAAAHGGVVAIGKGNEQNALSVQTRQGQNGPVVFDQRQRLPGDFARQLLMLLHAYPLGDLLDVYESVRVQTHELL